MAISRARDSFLVFGDMDIFDPILKTPRGILAKYLFANQDNELSFNYIAREDLTNSSNVDYLVLNGVKEHDAFLQNSIKNAQKEILIVSPWVRLAAIQSTNIFDIMEIAVKKGVKVSVYTDKQLNFSYCNNEKREKLDKELSQILTEFKNKGIEAKYVNNVHSKLLIKDNNLLCVGSFNWLGAQRKGKYVRHETSIVYQGKSNNIVNEIKLLKGSFESRFFTTTE
ncbi:phospholipase D-like domain-containing protein [uncultured Gilliamella sp.]|uniref:phospholipase D-like domain-containing protein n=1 Tax=uncultured Gilliamella sp. TaxID=1193505 RepID=UPI0026015637|nr:phospholipase D-like domain-containing protein [uncultured Gilliamella sp.]